jgi:hypothetical protein
LAQIMPGPQMTPPGGTARAQPPQFEGSLVVSVQPNPPSGSGQVSARQVQVPFRQEVSTFGQTIPQPPQLLLSARVLTQMGWL